MKNLTKEELREEIDKLEELEEKTKSVGFYEMSKFYHKERLNLTNQLVLKILDSAVRL